MSLTNISFLAGVLYNACYKADPSLEALNVEYIMLFLHSLFTVLTYRIFHL